MFSVFTSEPRASPFSHARPLPPPPFSPVKAYYVSPAPRVSTNLRLPTELPPPSGAPVLDAASFHSFELDGGHAVSSQPNSYPAAPYVPDRSIAPVFFPVQLAPPGGNVPMSGYYPPMFAMGVPTMGGGGVPNMGTAVGGGGVSVAGSGSVDSAVSGAFGRGGSMDAASYAAPMSPTLSAALPDFLYAAIGSSSPPLTSRSPLQRRGGTFSPAGDVATHEDGRPPVSWPVPHVYSADAAGGRGFHGESPLPQSTHAAAGGWNEPGRRGVRQFSRSAVEDAGSPGRDCGRGGGDVGSPGARGGAHQDHGRMQSPVYAVRGGNGSGSVRGLRRATGSASGYSRNELPPPQTLALREFRENVWQPTTLSDLSRHVVDFACDGVGVYFLIDLLKAAFLERNSSGNSRGSFAALDAAFQEVLASSRLLAMDAFGHLVLCSLFDLCSQAERLELASSCLLGNTLMLSLLVHGCRVVQKALVCLPLDFGARLAFELNDHLEECLHDANANHVVSKVVSSLDAAGSLFVLNYLRGNVFRYAIHPYGCRVLQNVFDVKSEESVGIIDELLTSVDKLVCENYGCVQSSPKYSPPGDAMKTSAPRPPALSGIFVCSTSYATGLKSSGVLLSRLSSRICCSCPSISSPPTWLSAASNSGRRTRN